MIMIMIRRAGLILQWNKRGKKRKTEKDVIQTSLS